MPVIRLRAARYAGRVRLALLLLLALPLGGCEWQTFKSSVAGSCAVFERPSYAVRGKAPYDQDVVDNFVESGVAGCNWTRPAPRPPQLDAPAGRKVAVASPAKRGLIRRLRERVLPARRQHDQKPDFPAAAAPIAPTPQLPAPPKPRRSAIDELLYPDQER
jgi:hypothetical protein